MLKNSGKDYRGVTLSKSYQLQQESPCKVWYR